ncbi:MAG: peptidoglycan binding domain-containing protein, partial [Candidatus Limnocylindrales bacterium]
MTDTVEQAPGPGARRPRRAGRYALIAFLVTFVIGTVLAAGSALVYGATYEGLIMPGVSIGGVRVGGLGRAEAESRLSGSVPVATLGELTMTVGDVRSVVPYSAIGRRYDFSAAITAAMTIGRTGNVIDRPAEQLRTLVRGADIGLAIGYDAALVDGSVADLVVSVERAPREARVIVDGSEGAAAAWRVEPAQTGVDVDEAALRAAAHSALDSLGLSNGSTQISIAPTFMEPRFTTAEAERAAAQANAISGTGLVLVDGTTTYSLTTATLRSWLTVAQTADGDFATSVDTASIGTMLPTLLAGIGTPATEASFKFGDGNTVLVVPGRTGRAVDLDATLDAVIGALDSRGAGKAVTSVPVSVVAVEPSFS